MNDNQTNERLAQAAQAAQVKRVFDLIDIIDDGESAVDVECEDCGACFEIALYERPDVLALRDELTDLLRSLGVEVVR